MQRAMFEIQGQQALMQADTLQIKILMDGDHQQEAAAGIREAGAVFLFCDEASLFAQVPIA